MVYRTPREIFESNSRFLGAKIERDLAADILADKVQSIVAVLSGTQYEKTHEQVTDFILSRVISFEKTAEVIDFSSPVSDLVILDRTKNCLESAGIYFVGDLVQKSFRELLDIPNLGRGCGNELMDKLAHKGLGFGMKLDNWVRPTIK